MKNLIAIAGSCLLAGVAIGYFAGNQKGDPRTAKENALSGDSRAVSSSSRRNRASGGNAGVGNRLKGSRPRTLEDVANTPGQTARLQALVDLYSNLSRGEFAGEADKLNDLPFNERILNAYGCLQLAEVDFRGVRPRRPRWGGPGCLFVPPFFKAGL